MRVLLHCSDSKTRSRLAYALRFAGAQVMEAVRPAKLVELARAERPDLVILDDPNAAGMAEKLREVPELARVTIALGLEVVRPCRAATYVWPSPVETASAVSLVRSAPASIQSA
jgi:hypothetical protein